MLSVLAGFAIPSILVESQPDLYCYVDDYTSPFPFVITTFAKALGFFFLWPLCFYALFGNKTKNFLSFIFFFAAVFAVINTFCFSGKYGSIEPTLIFMEPQHFVPSLKVIVTNALVFLALLVFSVFFLNRKAVILQSGISIFLFALIAISAMNFRSISKEFSKMEIPDTSKKLEPVYHLSKTGKNVIVFMQDACLTPIIPEIFKDISGLEERFEGFTYYPNTTTLGSVTMTGSPGLFGGYDYTPYEINKREDKTLQQKHNEALLSMPVLFNAAGFTVTISNLPYENYLEEPVTDMYKGYDFVNHINTTGKYSKIWFDRHGLKRNPHTSFLIKRNFICFSIFKMVPPILWGVVYSHKYWIAHDPYDDIADFADNCSSLEFLPELTDFDSSLDSFIIIDNELTHENVYASAVENKQDYIKIAVPNSESTRIRHNTKFKINPENWFTVHDDIYKKENWSNWKETD